MVSLVKEYVPREGVREPKEIARFHNLMLRFVDDRESWSPCQNRRGGCIATAAVAIVDTDPRRNIVELMLCVRHARECGWPI